MRAIPDTRFAGWKALTSGAVLAATLALMLYGLMTSAGSVSAPHPTAPNDDSMSDVKLYRSIAARVASGESYYTAVVAEQRAQHYPLRPVFTVRMPTLATIQARMGATPAYLLLCTLTLSAWLALARRFRAELGPGRLGLYASAVALVGLAPTLAPVSVYWHEAWAVVLIALSLALRTPKSWLVSVGFGFAAVAIRELALPYLCLMAALAAWEGNRREAYAWAAAIVFFLAIFALHAHTAAALVTSSDLASPGWSAIGGWKFVLKMMHSNTVLAAGGTALTATVVPLAVLGWAGWRSPMGLRVTLMLAGYGCLFMLVGRPDNDYWGLLLGPFLLVGLVFVPGALRDLAANLSSGWAAYGRNTLLPAE